MIPPRKHYQEKHFTYPNPSGLDVDLNSAAWQQNSGLRYENEQQFDLNSRASSYNSSYGGNGNAQILIHQSVRREMRTNQTMSNHLSPDTSSFRTNHPHNGNENDNPYNRAPFANMTTNGMSNVPNNRDGQPTETIHVNQKLASSLVQTPTNSNPSPERRGWSHIDDRQLPPKEVSPNTIEETYVLFIMCCNPSVPLSTDSGELRKGFNSPPKSDGKTFKTFTLFELIRKLELKELKTWAQLAIELGVEPPVLEKGQSAQKVQQYAVRLKRWMHAMHVDAFFEYLLGKPHVYWTQVPPIDEVSSEFGRDGVPPEEDLALRALLPETRPKRGRRKAEDKDNENEDSRSSAQRPRLTSPTLSEEFALARSAHPDHLHRFDDVLSIWPTDSVPLGQNMRWRLDDQTANTPLSAHPQSAIVSRANNSFQVPDNEPRSAITPSTSRSRRRHGPAVSSAWPSSSNNTSGKLRGRPPSNRSVTDGPFSTFPANPAKVGQTINFRDNTPAETPVIDRGEEPLFSFPQTFRKVTTSRPEDKSPPQRPDRLHLQVPERVGGTVRLATPPPPPPPTVRINGGAEETPESSSNQSSFNRSPPPQPHPSPISCPNYDIMGYLSAARREEMANPTANPTSHLQEQPSTSTHPVNQENPSNTTEPNFSFKNEAGSDRTNIDDLEAHFRLRILSAEWSDINNVPCAPCTIETADRIVKQTIRNLRDESMTQEAFLINLAALAGGRTLMTKLKMKVLKEEVVDVSGDNGGKKKKTIFESRWTLKFGAVEGSFTILQTCNEKLTSENHERENGSVRSGNSGEGGKGKEGNGEEEDEKTWKRKYLELQDRFYQKDDRVWGIRKNILDVLAATAGEHIV